MPIFDNYMAVTLKVGATDPNLLVYNDLVDHLYCTVDADDNIWILKTCCDLLLSKVSCFKRLQHDKMNKLNFVLGFSLRRHFLLFHGS